MQLFLETENTSVDLKEAMTTLEKDIIAVKNNTNDVSTNVPNGNNQIIKDKENLEDSKIVVDEENKIHEVEAESPVTVNHNDESSKNEEPPKLKAANNFEEACDINNVDRNGPKEKPIVSNGNNEPENENLQSEVNYNVVNSQTVTVELLNGASAVTYTKPADIVSDNKQSESMDSKTESIEESSSHEEVNNGPDKSKQDCADNSDEANETNPAFLNVQDVAVTEKDVGLDCDNKDTFKDFELASEAVESEENENTGNDCQKCSDDLIAKTEIEENIPKTNVTEQMEESHDSNLDLSSVNDEKVESTEIEENIPKTNVTERMEESDDSKLDLSSVNDEKLESTEIEENIPKTNVTEHMEESDDSKLDLRSVNDEKLESTEIEENIPKTNVTEHMEESDDSKLDLSSVNDEKLESTEIEEKIPKTNVTEQMEESDDSKLYLSSLNDEKVKSTEIEEKIPKTNVTERMEESDDSKLDLSSVNDEKVEFVSVENQLMNESENNSAVEMECDNTKIDSQSRNPSEKLNNDVIETTENNSVGTSAPAETQNTLITESADVENNSTGEDMECDSDKTPDKTNGEYQSQNSEKLIEDVMETTEKNSIEPSTCVETQNTIMTELAEVENNYTVEEMECETSDITFEKTKVECQSQNSSEKLIDDVVGTTQQNPIEISISADTSMELEEATNLQTNEPEVIKYDKIVETDTKIESASVESIEESSEPPEKNEVLENIKQDINIVTEDKNEPAVSELSVNIMTEDGKVEPAVSVSPTSEENKTLTELAHINLNTSTLSVVGCHIVEDKTKEETKDIKNQDATRDLLDKTSGDEVFLIEDEKVDSEKEDVTEQRKSPVNVSGNVPLKIKLSNTLNILSDDEDELTVVDNKSITLKSKTLIEDNNAPTVEAPFEEVTANTDKKIDNDKNCINLDDDDDIMLIDEELTPKETNTEKPADDTENKANCENISKNIEEVTRSTEEVKGPEEPVAEVPAAPTEIPETERPKESIAKNLKKTIEKRTPLLPENLFKNYRKNLADMTRDELEEFCILKIVESIIDRSDLNEIRSKLKTMAQNIDEYKKTATLLTKQNRDLKLVLTTIQDDQKKGGDTPVTPLKIMRSVGMQVLMTSDNTIVRKKGPTGSGPAGPNKRSAKNASQKQQAQANNNLKIPVPRLVPAQTNVAINRSPTVNQSPMKPQQPKPSSPMPNGVKNSPPISKAEKRPHNKTVDLTVDLTDDEPPTKIAAKLPSSPPVRLVPSQNLMAPRMQMTHNSPRKVYIPIGTPAASGNVPVASPQTANIRPGTLMLKAVQGPGPRSRSPMGPMVRIPQNSVRMGRVHNGRHPAPLPDVVKQYQSPNWKALPPAPDLKLSKVENGIVISWKIEGYQEDSYEEIASYQLYAYQETSAPPSTSLWKKIGDVKALPLPMACTLTQFMAGYKYYFAVRAVDVKSRLGPFSLPGSILLLNKM